MPCNWPSDATCRFGWWDRSPGLIVNLNSLLDVGWVWASHAGLADYIKNANGQRISDRQVRGAIEFLRERGHLRVDGCRGTTNQMFPLYRPQRPMAAEPADEPAPSQREAVSEADNASNNSDIMSEHPGHDVQGVRTSWPPKLSTKPDIKHNPPEPPYRSQAATSFGCPSTCRPKPSRQKRTAGDGRQAARLDDNSIETRSGSKITRACSPESRSSSQIPGSGGEDAGVEGPPRRRTTDTSNDFENESVSK
jgi:hypothetical protein